MPRFLRSRLSAALAFAAIVAAFAVPVAPAAHAADPPVSPLAAAGVGNVAHKGDSVGAPENTLAAVRQAIAEDANFVGIDVRRTRDGRLVVLHDARLRRVTNVERVFPRRARWKVDRFTLAQIRRLDAGSWESPTYTNERIPTLAQVLEELDASSTGAFLEIKQPDEYGGVDGIGDQVVRQIRRHTSWLDADGPKDRLVLQAFNDGFLKAFAHRYDNIVVGTLGSAERLHDYAGWADQINVHYRDVTPDLVNHAHRHDLKVSTYVVNRGARMRRVVEDGVDAISTDRPVRLHAVLRSMSRVMRVDGAPTAPPQPLASELAVRAPARALLDTRVPLRASLSGTDGSPARWTWVRVQLRTPDRWRTLQRRVTNRFGVLHTTVDARHRLRLRVVSETNDWHAASRPVVRAVHTRRARTHVRLYGDRRVVGSRATTLQVRWRAEDGRRITGAARLWAKPAGRHWRAVRSKRVHEGVGTFRVRPRRDTRYQVRAQGGAWWSGDRDGHYVNHVRRR